MISSYKKPSILLSIASILIICGVSIGVFWTSIFNKFLVNELVLSPTSRTFEIWKKTPIPMYLKVRLFNWTNPHEFHNLSIKPNFVEMGPYVFREVDTKVNTVWNDNDTLTVQQKRVWNFQPCMSKGDLDDLITNANPVAATVASSFRTQKSLVKKVLNIIMSRLKERLTVTKTVRELLFDGYGDRMLELAVKMNMTKLPFTRFGWFYSRNNSETFDGTFNIARGGKNIYDMAEVLEWNYDKEARKYSGKCDAVKGIIGDLWPPLLSNDTVNIFVPDICTHLTLKKSKSNEDFLGLEGYTYEADEIMLDNGTNVPSRRCYCENTECQPSGTLNVGACKYDAPVYFGLPHFYLADESYRQSISGMKPDEKKHKFSMTVEPTTGVPLRVSAKLQLNILVQPDDVLEMYKNVPKTYIPLMWFSQEANLTSDLADQVKFILTVPTLGHATLFGLAGIGMFLFFLGLYTCYLRQRKNEDIQVLLQD